MLCRMLQPPFVNRWLILKGVEDKGVVWLRGPSRPGLVVYAGLGCICGEIKE